MLKCLLTFPPCTIYFDFQLVQKLGWKGKGGRFDILPWLLQANGEDPVLYSVPEHLVLEVQIEHPRYAV